MRGYVHTCFEEVASTLGNPPPPPPSAVLIVSIRHRDGHVKTPHLFPKLTLLYSTLHYYLPYSQ